MGLELSQYLNSVLREGKLHSQGSFTLDFSRSKDLLGSALFAHPGNYLLKIVQCAFATGPHEIRVSMTRDTVQVSFSPKQVMPDLERVEAALRDPLKQTGLMRILALGVLAAVGQNPDMVLWGMRDINGGQALFFRAGEAGRIALPASTASECVFQFKRRSPAKPNFLQRLLGDARKATEESLLLSQACQFSTIPIFLDGRLINLPRFARLSRPAPFLHLGNSFDVLVERLILSCEPLAYLMLMPPPRERPAATYDVGYGGQDLMLGNTTVLHQWRSYNESERIYPVMPHSNLRATVAQTLVLLLQSHPNSVRLGERWRERENTSRYEVADLGRWTRRDFQVSYRMLSSERPLAGLAYLLSPAQPTDPQSWLYVVQNGVKLQPHPLTLGLPGMQVVLADNHLKTDLGGLSIVEDARLEAVKGWLLRESQQMRKAVRSVIRFGDKLAISGSQLQAIRELLEMEES